MNTITATPTECQDCMACGLRRAWPMPDMDVAGNEIEWAAWSMAQEMAADEDCICDHDTCTALDSNHDTECHECEHRYDADEDYDRER